MSQQTHGIYEFGSFRLDAQERLLQRDGATISLTPKAFDLLLVLVERYGRLVEKEELFKAVWPDTFVEESNLSSNIALIRKALGDGETRLKFIETIPKRGYRFVAQVREVKGARDPIGEERIGREGLAVDPDIFNREGHSRAPSVGRPQDEEFKPQSSSHKARYLLALSSLVIVVAGALAYPLLFRSAPKSPPMRIIPFTSFPGNEIQPSFSPDGNQIAFAWMGENSDHYNIYIKQIGNESVFQLTNGPTDDYSPSWSPDGRYIAFIRKTGKGFGFYIVPSLRGVERRITENTFYQSRKITWSPDSQWMGFDGSSSEQEPPSIYLMRHETGEMRKLTSPAAGTYGDWDPVISPDGKAVAFIREMGANDHDLYLVPWAGGDPKRLIFGDTSIKDLAWTADGREILFLASRGADCIFCLWRIPVTGGTVERVDLAGAFLGSLAVSRQGTRLALSNSTSSGNIWQIELTGTQKLHPKKLISSSRFDSSPQYSPDGKKIVFSSLRSGSFEIWVCDSDGQHPVQLTSNTRSGSPRWSPDGRQIVYDSVAGGRGGIYVINAEGGEPHRLTSDSSDDSVPSWSHDGQWIYFCSMRSGSLQIWKMPAAGGPAIQITKQGGFDNVESPDGRFLYYAKGRRVPGIWRVPIQGGAEVPVLDHHQAGYWRHWAVMERGIYFATAEDPLHPLIEFFSFATGQITPVARLEKQIPTSPSGLAVSPDDRKLIYSQNDQIGGDIMLLENFR